MGLNTNGLRPVLLGASAGFAYGYAGCRALQALAFRPGAPPAAAGRDAKRYARERRRLALAGALRGVAGLASSAFLAADPLERAVQPLPRPLRAPVFALTLLAADTLRDLGVDYVEGYGLERRWGLSEQSPRAWLADQAKALAVGGVVAAGLAALADAIVRAAPRRWPLIAIAVTPPLLAFANVIAPTFIMPLFNRFEPLAGPLEARIRALAARYGAGGAQILRFDLSRRTVKANAFVTGVLGTERIALGDTLLATFPDDEALFVVAHELGHYVRRDPWTAIAIGTVSVALTLAAGAGGLRRATGRGLDGPAQALRLTFFGVLAQIVLLPLANAASRALEARADRFAREATGDPAAGVRAFRRLSEQNLADPEPPRWAELLFGTHPSLAARIRSLEAG